MLICYLWEVDYLRARPFQKPSVKISTVLCLLTFLTIRASSQDAQEATKPERAPFQFHVLQGWKADLGDRSIYLNRVAPPVLPAPPIKIQETPQVPDAALAKNLTEHKKSEVLFLAATVFDRKLTEIRWMDNAHECRTFSNIDFNLFGGVVTFETADTVYSLLLAIVNETTEGLTDSGAPEAARPVPVQKQIPALEQFSRTQAQYLVVEDESGAAPQAKDLAALDALHLYFDANRQRLAEEFAAREAARIEQKQRPKEPPPKPKDTIVNFWPGNGTVIMDATRKGVKP